MKNESGATQPVAGVARKKNGAVPDGPSTKTALQKLDPNTQKLLNIWFRTRTREFAHTFAAERLEKDAHCAHKIEMTINISALLFLIIGLTIKDSDAIHLYDILYNRILCAKICNPIFVPTIVGHAVIDLPVEYPGIKLLAQLLILSSVILSLVALLYAVNSIKKDIIIMHGRHKLVARMFMSISQKVRRAETINLFGKNYDALIYSLNDTLETILTAGENPSDYDYKKAHQMMYSIMDSELKIMVVTFVPDISKIDIAELKAELISPPRDEINNPYTRLSARYLSTTAKIPYSGIMSIPSWFFAHLVLAIDSIIFAVIVIPIIIIGRLAKKICRGDPI